MQTRSIFEGSVPVLAAIACAIQVGCATGGGGGMDAGRRDSGGGDARIGDATIDAPRDAGMPSDALPPGDSGPVDAFVPMVDAGLDSGIDAGVDAGPPTCPPTPETVAIVEVMVASLSGSTDRGEWIEIVNAGTCWVDVSTLTLVNDTLTFNFPSRALAPGARMLIAQSGVAAENHGITPDAVWTAGLVLGNGGDTIELRSGATLIDSVTWTSGGHTASSARMFPDTLSITQNDSQVRWCNATAVYATVGASMIRGTPGTPNGGCP